KRADAHTWRSAATRSARCSRRASCWTERVGKRLQKTESANRPGPAACIDRASERLQVLHRVGQVRLVDPLHVRAHVIAEIRTGHHRPRFAAMLGDDVAEKERRGARIPRIDTP